MSGIIALQVIGGLAALTLGGELLIRGASRLAATLGVPAIIIGLTVVAFGTSTPELAVSLDAAFRGNADIAVANVVGSNIFNILFILGVSALVSPLLIHSQMIFRELPIVLGASLLLAAFAWNGNISRIEGAILFVGIIFYTSWLVVEALKKRRADRELRKESEREYGEIIKKHPPVWQSAIILVVGLGIIMVGADWLVKGAISLAQTLGVSDTVIGLTIVAAGTSLPEVVASVMATIKGERDIAVGNVIGSNLYNILAIVGLSGAIVPSGLSVNASILSLDLPVMLAATALCIPFFLTGRTLSRIEGGVFLSAYIGYTVYLVSNA